MVLYLGSGMPSMAVPAGSQAQADFPEQHGVLPLK